MNVSPRTILELVTGVVAAAVLAWLGLSLAWTKTDLANARTALKTKDLIVQAKDMTVKSCQLALGQVQLATGALVDATQLAYASADKAALAAQGRAQVTALTVGRLLKVRAEPGQDCQTATGLARAAWEEGQ